ncbi:MAG: hypothetical protein JXR40_08505 [Pontiellaceae bacterium]|nr:hypothetical protein [Pontiellaceae bacterium]
MSQVLNKKNGIILLIYGAGAIVLSMVLANRRTNPVQPEPPKPIKHIHVVAEASTAITPGELNLVIHKLKPLHQCLDAPEPGEWLYRFDEPGQTFLEYLQFGPTLPQDGQDTIYIQPIGTFTETQQQILNLTAEYMGLYYNLPITVNETIPLSTIPEDARRTHPQSDDKQILTTYILHEILKPNLPLDAAASIAFTSSDLWPGNGWNFVFGEASVRDRVGVWSIYRSGDPDLSERLFQLCLRRTLQTATHETGHMFSMFHCTAYECCMGGSMDLKEADGHPLYLCPECTAKMCWAMQVDPVERFTRLRDFCQKHGLQTEAEYYQNAINALSN